MIFTTRSVRRSVGLDESGPIGKAEKRNEQGVEKEEEEEEEEEEGMMRDRGDHGGHYVL